MARHIATMGELEKASRATGDVDAGLTGRAEERGP